MDDIYKDESEFGQNSERSLNDELSDLPISLDLNLSNHSKSPRRPVPFRGREELGTLPNEMFIIMFNLSPVCTWAS